MGRISRLIKINEKPWKADLPGSPRTGRIRPNRFSIRFFRGRQVPAFFSPESGNAGSGANDGKTIYRAINSDKTLMKNRKKFVDKPLTQSYTIEAGQTQKRKTPVLRLRNCRQQTYGEVAQLARARGSYPRCRGFKSPPRYDLDRMSIRASGLFFFTAISGKT